MLVSKKAMTMPPCKVTALFEIMHYGVHRILTLSVGSGFNLKKQTKNSYVVSNSTNI